MTADSTINDVEIKRGDSKNSVDSVVGPVPTKPLKLSASASAETAAGRQQFMQQFTVCDESGVGLLLTNSSGVPLSRFVTPRLPSQQWLEDKRDELKTFLATDAAWTSDEGVPQLRGVQAHYLGDIIQVLDTGARERENDANKQASDKLLSKHFAKLEQLCVEVVELRATNPPPAEDRWGSVFRQIMAIATEHWKWAFDSTGGSPPPLAMPRVFARSKDKVVREHHGFPTTFKPDYSVTMAPTVIPGPGEYDRLFRCLSMTKKKDRRGMVSLPVLAAQLKSKPDDLPHAHGQIAYSAVQAAGIFQNADVDLQLLTLAVAQGIVEVGSCCWPGKIKSTSLGPEALAKLIAADACLVSGQAPIDLGTLSGVVSLVMLVHDASRIHVMTAHDVESLAEGSSGQDLDALVCDRRTRPALLPIYAGPLVDWRARAPTANRPYDASGPGKTAASTRAGNVQEIFIHQA
ncbi:hypothetical protein DFH06DRAFT_1474963 [Mycena polygramma]|nr:hypothetical protein DFH06DRAFT_1474963 [Mycena polygramma]